MPEMLRLTVTDQDGILLDTTEVSRDEFLAAQRSLQGAWALLNDLQIGQGA